MLVGAGLLWIGWTGFNGGAPYAASMDASLAALNTHVCEATSLLTWLVLDTFIYGKPSAVGAVQGMITGLVCITPGAVGGLDIAESVPTRTSGSQGGAIVRLGGRKQAYERQDFGVVQCWAAILMGIISGSVPWYTMMVLHHKIKLLRYVDDTMAVFHTHAIAGSLGGILTGFFAVPKLSRLFYMVLEWERFIGLAYGLQSDRSGAGF
ncbi:ammonium transporter 2 member 4-like [Cornus florida]|uniref:ammonium transporter 2 member 4-like n=1 Tax=Cornus florida TaxID=4283 RepID=UPI0028A04A96|nr:ammonium transporter 2 member 4-like [Cornus florida]